MVDRGFFYFSRLQLGEMPMFFLIRVDRSDFIVAKLDCHVRVFENNSFDNHNTAPAASDKSASLRSSA
jgi:hypothetical protein